MGVLNMGHGNNRLSQVTRTAGPIHGPSGPILSIMRRTTERRSSARAYKIAGHRPVSIMISHNLTYHLNNYSKALSMTLAVL